MSFYVKFDDVEVVDVYARSRLSDMSEKLEGIWKAIEGLAGASGFEGAAADKAKEYLSGVHGLLYGSIQTILVEYQQLVLMYKDGYYTGVDSDPHAEFDEDRLLEVEESMGRRAGDFEAQAAELEAAVGSVADLLSFFGPRNGESVAADVRQVGVRARDAREAVGQYEASHVGDLGSVRDQVGQIGAVLDRYCGAHGSLMTGFDAAAFGQSPAVVALCESSVAIQAGQQARAGELEGVFAREMARAEVLKAEAARERAKWGWIKAVGAVVTIAVGVVVVVATAGAAAPLLVLGVAAVGSTLFGAADLVEAAGDIYYGSKGDAYTQAFNPLRDTVFAGNQTMYDWVGFGVCAVASAGIPIGLAAKAGTVARIGGVARASLREGVEDLATQKATEWATPYLGAETALAAGILAGGSLGKVGGGSVPKAHAAPPKTGTGGMSTPKTPDVPKAKVPDVPKAQPVSTSTPKVPDASLRPSVSTPTPKVPDVPKKSSVSSPTLKVPDAPTPGPVKVPDVDPAPTVNQVPTGIVDGAPGSGVLSALQRQKIAMFDKLIARHADKPWLVKLFDGSRFNWERAHAHDFNEVAVTRKGSRRPFRLDSYTPGAAVVSRKATQLAEIDIKTAKRYIDEALKKYNPRTDTITIADTNANKLQFADRPDLIGTELRGSLKLEVPAQKAPIPPEILEYAKRSKVTIVSVDRIR